MSFAQLSPDFDVFESSSTGDAYDTNGISSDMTAIIVRVASGEPACGVDQRIQHADTITGSWIDHPATITFNGNSAVVSLTRVATKRYIRITELATAPTGDPLFVAGGILIW